MHKSAILIALLIQSVGWCQPDTSDVFIVGDQPLTNQEDTTVVTRVQLSNGLKLDYGKIWTSVIISYEHLIDNDCWSLEYELSADIESNYFWYDYYTGNRFYDVADNTLNSPGNIKTSYMFFGGAGVTLKHYLSKRRSGISGFYVALKARNRFGWVDVTNYIPNAPDPVFVGLVNLFEIAPTIGYSFYLWNFLIVDPFFGPSAILSSTKYPTYEEGIDGSYWQPHKFNQVLPAIHFGVRAGVSIQDAGSLFVFGFQNLHF